MSIPTATTRCTAFADIRRIASGDPRVVVTAIKAKIDAEPTTTVLVFDDKTAEQLEFDLRGSLEDILARLNDTDEPEPQPRGPGRPRLGVVAREVTLLPRHWEWLANQPGGASAALRKLVEAARRENTEPDRIRTSRDATYRFMNTMAGNEAGFEEATRALYAGDRERFAEHTSTWPEDVRDFAAALSAETW